MDPMKVITNEGAGTGILTNPRSRNGHIVHACVEVILQVIKAVNDSLQQGNIRGLPEVLYPLGGLVCQEVFSVHIENKQQSSHIFKSRKQTRQVLLFDTQLVFCKVKCPTNSAS